MALWIGLFPQIDYVHELRSASLYSLFFPNETYSLDEVRMNNLTPAQSVRAIDAFGTGAGNRCWLIALETE